MLGGVLKTISRIAVVAAAGLFISGFNSQITFAADFGGDCCADLEERVAELEATTVRKRSRKLSMTISGRVNYALIHWDDGGASDGTRDDDTIVSYPSSAPKLQFDGRARISQDWEAGYRFSIELLDNARGLNWGQFDRPTEAAIDELEAYWFIRNEQLGAISVGLRGQTYSGAAKVDVSGKTGIAGQVDPRLFGGGIRLRTTDGVLTDVRLGDAYMVDDGDDGAGERNGIRYDSPSFAGFILSADWVNDDDDFDVFGVRLTYAGQIGDFKIAGAVAYFQEDGVKPTDVFTTETSGVLGSLGVMHVPTGLFVNAGGGETDYDVDQFFDDDNANFWYVTAGIQQNWFAVGPTTIFGQYYSSEDNDVDGASNSEYDAIYWGGGVTQNIAAASLDLYLAFRQYETDVLVNGLKTEDVQVFLAGGVINF